MIPKAGWPFQRLPVLDINEVSERTSSGWAERLVADRDAAADVADALAAGGRLSHAATPSIDAWLQPARAARGWRPPRAASRSATTGRASARGRPRSRSRGGRDSS